ncbi:uncharacterized protein N7511_005906 [Penicillium nucicola]|uniref:uncharacterized protein n=1 Tax=Penicillium nucicola TaxID=1850975 RepID=UPI002545A591|nr:uncharacterized protein N7511_005906 [Penicillium nucicola]KAJ5762524.1 hypothetical protein N7511_005906 [Penicillium nucicola]
MGLANEAALIIFAAQDCISQREDEGSEVRKVALAREIAEGNVIPGRSTCAGETDREMKTDIDVGLRAKKVFDEVESRSGALRGFRAGGQRRRESRRNLRAGREEGEMKSSSQESIPANWIRSDEYSNG